MKRFIIFIIAIAIAIGANAQNPNTIVVKDKIYSVQQNKTATDIKTDYLYEVKEGETYPIYISKTGKAYIFKVSKKTGNEYKYYLNDDIAKDIIAKEKIKIEKK